MFGSSLFSNTENTTTNCGSQYIPSASSALGSLSRLGKKGMNNIHRAKKTGKEYAKGLYSTKVVSNETSKFKVIPEQAATTNTGFSIEPALKNIYHTIQENESQYSFDSEATTLVNSPSTSSSFINNKWQPTNKTAHNDFSAPSSKRSSYSSRSSLRMNSTPHIEFSKTKISLLEQERLKMELHFKSENVDILQPCPEIKEAICTFGHDTAHEIGKTSHLHYYQLPFPWRENRYIIYNYRFYDSHKKSLLSIINWYGWHNESSNIWTHLLGALYMMYLATYEFPNSEVFQSSKIPTTAKCITFLFLLAALKCLLASTFWHTFNGTSFLRLRRRFACVDYTGITILITASILTTEFATLYNYKMIMCLYMGISLTLGCIGVYLNCSPKFDSPESRPLRIKFFVFIAAMGILSFCQTTYLEGLKFSASLLTPVTNRSVVWYCIGVVFYGSFIPERFRTDVKVDKRIPTQDELASDINIIARDKDVHFRESPTCCQSCPKLKSILSFWWVDYVGSSHTMWHFFVVLGVIGHYRAIIEIYTKRWLQV